MIAGQLSTDGRVNLRVRLRKLLNGAEFLSVVSFALITSASAFAGDVTFSSSESLAGQEHVSVTSSTQQVLTVTAVCKCQVEPSGGVWFNRGAVYGSGPDFESATENIKYSCLANSPHPGIVHLSDCQLF